MAGKPLPREPREVFAGFELFRSIVAEMPAPEARAAVLANRPPWETGFILRANFSRANELFAGLERGLAGVNSGAD